MRIIDFQKMIPEIKKAIELQVQVALTECAAKIAEDAKHELGVQQADWAPLADTTIKRKQQKGLDTPSPLLASGALKESIEYVVEGHTAVIGTNDPVAVYQELGTEHIPPRPFLSKAAINNSAVVEKAFNAALRRAFT